jgi:hypothetical protein
MMKMMARTLIALISSGFLSTHALAQQIEPIWDEAVGGADTVFLEEMTAGEIAAAIRDGFTSVIVVWSKMAPMLRPESIITCYV